MVMAAGLGKRMRPLTITTPKPLVRVAGKPLIDHVLDHLGDAGMRRVIVNVHYLADSLEAHLNAREHPFEVMISDERDLLLETGGGLVKALPMIDEDPFFCLNSDNVWLESARSCFDELRAAWDDSRMDALLLVVPHTRACNYQGVGDFHLDQMGRVSRRRAGHVAPYIYTGIQLLSRRLLVDPPEGAFSTNVLWNRAIEADRLFGIAHLGQWFDVGTPAAIKPTAEALLND
ncbi:nucleotidyltransferase family protein [Sphingomonas sp. 35-24ZXX]|uniref:nucleotidyltransferase family protein n=1 Tax=Sphingomonas sp. 35-24ZXX TaxID=1545915 RepID=UPI0012E0611A|nr:nucleotidyltransferase family protein [Sphingomonas sp. 35-24ZXX]